MWLLIKCIQKRKQISHYESKSSWFRRKIQQNWSYEKHRSSLGGKGKFTHLSSVFWASIYCQCARLLKEPGRGTTWRSALMVSIKGKWAAKQSHWRTAEKLGSSGNPHTTVIFYISTRKCFLPSTSKSPADKTFSEEIASVFPNPIHLSCSAPLSSLSEKW